VRDGAAITIRELLGHRSGLADFGQNPGYNGPYLTGQRPIGYEWTPDQLLALATSQPAAFAPNSRFGYSNTNYLSLRMIVETATGERLPTLLQQRIFAPLGMRSTMVDHTPGIAGPAAHGFMTLRVPGFKRVRGLIDVTGFNGSVGWGAGDMSSTARDLARFFRALVGGQLLRPDLLDTMLDSPSGVHYGLGIQRTPKPSPCGQLYGHQGDFPGYHTSASITRTGRFSLVMVNLDDETTPVPPRDLKVFYADYKAVLTANNASCQL
jgi:D-alanyl-D-alanine carboxypeptidase